MFENAAISGKSVVMQRWLVCTASYKLTDGDGRTDRVNAMQAWNCEKTIYIHSKWRSFQNHPPSCRHAAAGWSLDTNTRPCCAMCAFTQAYCFYVQHQLTKLSVRKRTYMVLFTIMCCIHAHSTPSMSHSLNHIFENACSSKIFLQHFPNVRI